MGALTAAEFDAEEARTDPNELCAELHVDGGQALPEEMQAIYRELTGKKSHSLPVIKPSA